MGTSNLSEPHMKEGKKRSREEEGAQATGPEDAAAIDVSAGPPQIAVLAVPVAPSGPPLYPFEPHPDFTAFWQQLQNVDFEANTRLLRLRGPEEKPKPKPNPFPDLNLEWIGAIYVRKCYEELATHVGQMRKLGQPFRSTKLGNKMVVTGTVGMGKTVWLVYLMWQLAKDTKIVILERSDFHSCFLFTPEGAFEGKRHVFEKQLADKDAFYLVDKQKPEPAGARTILTCPPVDRICRGIRGPGASQKIMPPWSLEELEHARKLVGNRTEEQMRADFGIWGGVSRCMQWNEATVEVEAGHPDLNNLLDEVSLTEEFGEYPWLNPPPLVHMIPDAELDFSHFDVCSKRIAELVVDAAYPRGQLEELKRFLESSGTAHRYAGIRGSLWRTFVLRAYSKGSSVEYRDLQQPGSSRKARVPPATVQKVASLDETKEYFSKERKGNRRVFWREPEGGLEPLSFLRLPGKLCVITTQLDNLADNCGVKEALTVLTAETEGTGKELQITWIAPRPEFDKFQLQELKLDAGAAEVCLPIVKQRVMTPVWPVQA